MAVISVVVNTCNSERFLLETIRSVQNQTFTDFELIIVDDGSQDDTLAIATKIQDRRIQIHAYPNEGIAKSRNRALKHASGEFIAYLDHDDRWHQRKLEDQYLVLTSHPQAAMAYCWIEFINEQGNSIRTYPPIHYSGQVYPKLLAKNFLITMSNPLIRKENLVKIGGFDETIYGADDWDLFIQLAKQYEVALSPHYHVQYRVVEGSSSAKSEKMEQGCLQVIEKSFQVAPQELQPIKPVALGTLYQYLCFRTLEEMSNRKSAFLAWQYLQKSYGFNSLLWSKLPLSKAIFKIFVVTLSPSIAKRLSRWITKYSK